MDRFEVGAWDDAGVHLIQVVGEFDLAACKSFRRSAYRADAELIVVDLRHTSFLDSSALGELITLHRRTTTGKVRLAILRPDGNADLIFKLTGMDGHLPLYDDRVPVLAEFNYG